MFMFWRLKNRFRRLIYRAQCARVFQTPPLLTREAPLKYVTMCSHDDLTMYLLAIKSLYREIGEGTVVVLNDGSLTPKDKSMLSHHIAGVTIEDIADVKTDPCPKGGTWERLLKILELTDECYVIQVDADTLTQGEVAEVLACYRGNRAFSLGTSAGQKLVSLEEASHQRASDPSTHVQAAAERSFIRLPSSDRLRYARMCSGFAGFPRGLDARESVHEFSRNMMALIGAKWNEWGSEQVTSNYLVANSPGAVVLPVPKYATFHPQCDLAQAAFVHFIGSWRFHKNVYAHESRRTIRELMDADGMAGHVS
jgi:hypothetical protein